MGDKDNASGDWKSERISMTHLANLGRSSNYVRSLVRQQFHQQSDQPATAWARLRERLAKTGHEESFDTEEDVQRFLRKKGSGKTAKSDSDGSSGDEEEEETYVYLKTASPEQRYSITADNRKSKAKETPPSSSGYVSSPSARRLSAPQTPFSGLETEKTEYTFGSTDAHSKILNRRLSLAENVIKNYSKYIRTPDVDQAQGRTPRINIENERAGSDREQTSKKPSIAAISEEEGSALANVKLVDSHDSTVSSPSVDFLVVPQGSSYTVPPSPAAESENSFFDAPVIVRRNSLSGTISEELSFTRSGTDVTSKATKEKLASDTLPRISQTSKSRSRKVSANSREEAIKELRKDHKKLAKNKLLKQRTSRKKETFYQQLKRDQERRALQSEIFNREMEEIRKTLKGINSRLDERIKVLDCYNPPKVNAKLHRILQVALAGIPFSK